MLGHDDERHDPNTATTPSKIADELDIIYFNNTLHSRVKITSISNEINFNINYKRGGVAPGGLALLLVVMSFGGHFGQPVPIPTHPPIGQVVPYRPICGNWHRFAKKATKKT